MKDLELTAGTASQSVTVDALMLGEFLIGFEIETEKGISAALEVLGGGYPTVPLTLAPDGSINSFGGAYAGSYDCGRTAVAVAVRPDDDCADIYVNGRLALKSCRADSPHGRCVWADKCISYRFTYRAEHEGHPIKIYGIHAFETDIRQSDTSVPTPIEGKREPDRTIRRGGGSIFSDSDGGKALSERPSAERMAADLAQVSGGEHPRIMATAADFERIKKECVSDPNKKRWFAMLLEYCGEIMKRPALKYELRDGFRLMYVSDEYEDMMLSLGMAYRLTGDRKYADAAWVQTEAVANFPDWNPFHHIDVGIMANGMAVAYDWFYDCLTDEQRELMERAVRRNCFYIANLTYEGDKRSMGGVDWKNNHNVLCNCGILTAAAAFGDTAPDIAPALARDAVRALEIMLGSFSADGAWYEGPHYAAVALRYLGRMLAAMRTAYGSLYSLDRAKGLDKAAEYLLYSQSDVSCYNFADGDPGIATCAELFWFFTHYKTEGIKKTLAADRYGADMKRNVEIAQCLLFYDVRDEGGKTLPTDKYYKDISLITIRSSWEKGQRFLGVKAGDTVYDHSHLDSGSFVFDFDGVRWAWDMGKDDYNLKEYCDREKRNNIFRIRPESHNLLVINPADGLCIKPGERAEITELSRKTDKTIIKIDMSRVMCERAESAERGFLFTNGRHTLIVRDEVILGRPSELYWLLYTKADAEIIGSAAVLRDRNDPTKKLRAEFVSSAEGELYFEPAAPMPFSPRVEGQNGNKGFYRLVYKMRADGKADITVKLETERAETYKNWNVPIADW